MPGLSDTAYPRLKPNPSAKELDEMYTPNLFEGSWVEQRTREPVPRIGLLVLLKTFQKLGYFVMLDEVPRPILQHIAQSAGYEAIPDGLGTYDASSVRRRHMALVRDYVGVSTWCEAAQKIVADACRDAARTRDDLADIINVALRNWSGSATNCQRSIPSCVRREPHAQRSIRATTPAFVSVSPTPQ